MLYWFNWAPEWSISCPTLINQLPCEWVCVCVLAEELLYLASTLIASSCCWNPWITGFLLANIESPPAPSPVWITRYSNVLWPCCNGILHTQYTRNAAEVLIPHQVFVSLSLSLSLSLSPNQTGQGSDPSPGNSLWISTGHKGSSDASGPPEGRLPHSKGRVKSCKLPLCLFAQSVYKVASVKTQLSL